MRLQHQLTPPAVRRLRHLLLLGFELRQASSLKHGRAIHQQQVADSGEGNLTDPDFKHKQTQQTLWLDDKLKTPWMDVELASLTQRRQGKRKQQSSVFSWNTRLTKYFKAGQHHKTIEHFQQMQQQGMVPDSFTFIRVLNACASLRALEEGRHIHMQIVESCVRDGNRFHHFEDGVCSCRDYW
ncbi:unnamed protein product [Sphagnum balticum]